MSTANRVQNLLNSLAEMNVDVPPDGDRYMVMIGSGQDTKFISLGGIAGLAKAVRTGHPPPEDNGHA